MPYAAKATVEHEFVTDHLELYVTFRQPMKLSSEPLTVPPVWDIMPPLSKWLLDADAVDIDIVDSEWLDLWTLLLTSDTIATYPSEVKLEYDGPDLNLRTSWDKQWEAFGPILSSEIITGILANLCPKRATLWHDEAIVLTGNVFTHGLLTSNRYCTRTYQDAPANGDSFSHSFLLAAGTYDFTVLGGAQTQYGMLDWYIDGVKVVSGQDWFAWSVTYNVLKITTGITVVYDGYHHLRGIVNGKNANATSYYISLIKYFFSQTSDSLRV